MSVPRVIVRNLDRSGVREGDKEEIRGRFREYGPVTNVWMADDPPGFAYVFFETFKDAIKAVDELNGERMCGRRVDVELSPSEDKRKNRGGWAARFGEGRGGGYSGDRGGGDRSGGGFRDNYRPRGRGGFRSYDRDSRDDRGGGNMGRDYDNRGQRFESRDSYGGGGGSWGGGRGRGGYNNYRGGGGGYRGRGGGYQQRWGGGGRGGYRNDGGYRGRGGGGFNRDRGTGEGYSGGRYHQGDGGRGRGGGYYERDSYDRRSRRDYNNFSDEEGGGSRTKDYEYRDSRRDGGSGYSRGGGGDDHKEHSRPKRYSSPEYAKEEVRSSKYRKHSDGDDYQQSDYRHSQPSSKWDSSPSRHPAGGSSHTSRSPNGNYNRSRSRSHSHSPYTAPEYFSPPSQDNYRGTRKSLEKRSGSYEHVDQYPAVEENYSSGRSYDRHSEYSPEPAEPGQFGEYNRDRGRMVKYGDLAEGSRSGSRHYKSKRAGSDEPVTEHKVREVEGGASGGGRYMELEEKGVQRSRGHERSAHPRAYQTSREPSERENRSPPPPPPPPRRGSPPSHPKRSVSA